MPSSYRAAAVQMSSTEDKEENLRTATARIEQAAAAGAELIVLPEMFTCYGRPKQILAATEPVPGPTSELLCSLARRLSITLVAGSLCEQSAERSKAYNTSLLIGPDGNIAARYRKRHLFNVEIPGEVSSRESSWLLPGEEISTAVTPRGTIGLAICYDLRFPEHFRLLADAGCNVLCVPSAFTRATGRDHWEVLLRARAIENQSYVIAANQVGCHAPGLITYGHSMIVDPWGTVLSVADDDDEMVCADVDLARVVEVRSRLPALAHRRNISCA